MIIKMAFSTKAIGGGMCGSLVVSMSQALRYGISRGVFSNEAGMGGAAISATAARTDNYVKQGYISMTGVLYDTMLVCTLTGLCIASSGVLGLKNEKGDFLTGAELTIASFKTVLGDFGAWFISIAITVFAFATIVGWEYQGEKAFEYLVGSCKYNLYYKIIYSLMAYFGATMSLNIVWGFSDLANALMAIPNLICLLMLRNEISMEVKNFEIDSFKC